MASSNQDLAVFESAAVRQPLLKWFAIADSAQHPEVPTGLRAAGCETRCLFGSSPGSPVSECTPHLVQLPLPSGDSSAWHSIIRNARLKPSVSVIATGSGFDTLFAQLRQCLDVMLPDGELMFLAFWDPAILGSLLGQLDDDTLHVKGPVLTLDQRNFLVRGLAHWWYWDRKGAMHAIDTSLPTSALPATPIKLTQGQVDDLVEASVPDHVAYFVELNQPLLIAHIPKPQRYEVVRQALVKAREIGLVAMRDLVNFVCVTLIYGERMSRERPILDILKKVKEKQIDFHEAARLLP